MNRIVILVLVLLLPNSIAEMSHSPKEVSEGETFTALIDTEEDVVSVTFYVCTLEEPYTCYKPVKQNREDTVNGRFEFTYEVKSNDYPGYKYELENEDNSTENIPASEYSYYDGMNVVKMQDSYYFKVDVKSQEEKDDSLLYAPNLILTIATMAIIALTSRK
jgi:hypothetical protein